MNEIKRKLYKKNLEKLNFLFESLEDEESYLYSNHKWLVDMTPNKRDYYSFQLDENKTLLFSDGDVAIVSTKLLESSDGSWLSSIYSFFTHSWHNLTMFFTLIKEKKFSDTKILLGLGTLLEIINLILALVTPIGKGITTFISISISQLFIMGGLMLIANSMNKEKAELSPKDTTEQLQKKITESGEKVELMIEGVTSILLGVLTFVISFVPAISKFSNSASHWLEGVIGKAKGFIKNGLITLMKKVLLTSTHGVSHLFTHLFSGILASTITAISVKVMSTIHLFENKKYKPTNMLFEGEEGGDLKMSDIFTDPGKVVSVVGTKFTNLGKNILTAVKKVDLGMMLNWLIEKLANVLNKILKTILDVLNVVKGFVSKVVGFIKNIYETTKLYLAEMKKSGIVLNAPTDFGITDGGQKPIEKDVIKKEVGGLSKDKDKQEKLKAGIDKVVVDNSNLKNILSFDNFLNERNLNFNNL